MVLRNIAPWAKLAFAYYVTLSHLAVEAHSLCALVSQTTFYQNKRLYPTNKESIFENFLAKY